MEFHLYNIELKKEYPINNFQDSCIIIKCYAHQILFTPTTFSVFTHFIIENQLKTLNMEVIFGKIELSYIGKIEKYIMRMHNLAMFGI